MLYMIFQYGLEPVLIQRILGNGFRSQTGKRILTLQPQIPVGRTVLAVPCCPLQPAQARPCASLEPADQTLQLETGLHS